MINYFQQGGYDNSTDFSQFAEMLSGQQQSNDDAYSSNNDFEQVDNEEDNTPDITQDANYQDLYQKYNELQNQLQYIQEKYGYQPDASDNAAVDIVKKYSETDNEPINWMEVNNDFDNYESKYADYHNSYNNFTNAPTQINVPNRINPNTQQDNTQYPKGTTASVRNNNPGNIKYSDFSKNYGAVPGGVSPEGNQFAKFPNVQAGIEAQKALLTSKNYKNLSVEKAMNRWVTGNPDKQGPYSKRLANMFGNKKISDLSSDELNQLVNQQIKNEDINQAKALGIKQKGGFAVANTSQQQYEGLNNPYFGTMYFPNEGHNTFRGLDNKRPVYVIDENGKEKVLTGPNDKAKMFGNVLEHKL